ncbi:hypothetical protein F1721_27590 [Saccharopolyspora hirsuta]|uniref:Uncharacterized protein n=1 Tax=Saccharopolyspora hirsuta TaxID=1837 RepID=A0A5M7BL06_SACHI|nr:hypothetical protein F1721_27590 [Saccharopolyspora hirsuta]
MRGDIGGTVERLRAAAGPDWRFEVREGAVDGSARWAEVDYRPAETGPGSPTLSMVFVAGRDGQISIRGELRASCVPPLF